MAVALVASWTAVTGCSRSSERTDAGSAFDTGVDAGTAAVEAGLDAPLDGGPDAPPDAGTCGDAVVQGDEECDDGNTDLRDGCEGCRLGPCDSSLGFGSGSGTCPADRPWCSAVMAPGDVLAYCRAGIDGGRPPGAECSADAECETGFCSADQGRCSHRVQLGYDCGPGGFTGLDVDVEPGAHTFAGPCEYACGRDADCPGARRCRLSDNEYGSHELTFCAPLDWASERGEPTLDVGSDCFRNDACVAGACDSVAGCSSLCVTDADCTDPLRPRCGEISDFRTFELPPGWPTTRPQVCLAP